MNDYKFHVKIDRPEEKFKHVTDYYKGKEIENYATSKSLMKIQEEITIRALEILEPEQNDLILDLGCGPGFASFYLEELGYRVIGLDLIFKFLNFYDCSEINPLHGDMCALPFRPHSIDHILSISALQWIFRDPLNMKMENALKNLAKDLALILKPEGKSIFQFYPKNDEIMEKMGSIFKQSGNFEGGFIIDNPQSAKKRKVFLFLIQNI